MKLNYSLLLSIVFSAILLSSCVYIGPSVRGNGNVVKENRDVGEFERIRASRGMNVYISQGDTAGVVVEADENITSAIETRVEGGVLEIRAISNIRSATSKKVFVTVPKISLIKGTAGSNVYSETPLETGLLEIKVSAGSNVKLEVNARKIDAIASAGSNLTLTGTSEEILCKASAGSNIFGEELKTKTCDAKASSGSNIWITAETDLNGKASSGGNVFYFGNPGTTNIEKSSGGNVIKK